MPEIDDSFAARLNLAFTALGGQTKPPSRILAMHLGEASSKDAEEALSKLPPSTLLLYLTFPSSGLLTPQDRINLAGKGVIVEAFDKSGFLRERIFSCVEAVRAAKARLSAAKELPQDIVQWLQTNIDDAFEKRNDRMRTWQTRHRCALANFPCIAGPRRLEMPSFDPAVPVVVCGAGPTIKGQLGLLREIQGRAVIVCAGRAAKMLSEAGVNADYVVDIEQKAQLYWPEGLNLPGALVAHESVSPVVPPSFSKYIWTNCGYNILGKTLAACGMALPSIPANGPVASIMIGFALSCGARRLALCGYDLSVGADGKSYADGQGAMDKSAPNELKVPSVAGGTVDTLPQFEAMRRDVQACIDMLRKAGMLFEIYNCSPSGAVVAGTMPMTLQGFIETYAKTPKTSPDVFAPAGKSPFEALGRELSAATKAQDAVYKLAKAVAKTDEELSKARPDLSQTQRFERKIEELFKEELATRTGPQASELSAGAFEQARLLSEQWPRARQTGELTVKRLHFKMLLRQCLLHEGLLKDLIQELRDVAKAKGGGFDPAGMDVHNHPALREHAIRLIRQDNPELAATLEHMAPAGGPAGFDIFHMLISPPIVLSMPDASGGRIPLAEAGGYTAQIQGAALRLLKESAFDPAKDAIVLSGHVNWGLASEIAFRCPDARMIVVFPWLELLSHMAGTCEFMGLLPEGSLLVCPSEQCANWREPLEGRLTLWKRSTRRILLFENEATSSLPEMQAAREAVKSLLR